jgi:hypothetical protein
MIIKLKLVGNNEETNVFIDKDTFTITDIFNYLMEHNLSFNEISKIMFIHNGKDITNDDIIIVEENINIHLFVKDSKVKNELLINVFNKETNVLEFDNYSNESPEDRYLSIEDRDLSTEDRDLSTEDVNKHNESIIELFNDNDFTYLLKICLTKPDLINKVSSYLLNGNITTKIKNIDMDEFKYNETYLQLNEILNKINHNKTELEIKSTIQHFEGNLNLSLRYLLTKY